MQLLGAVMQVIVNNAVQVAATGQLQTGVQFKITDPSDIEPSVRMLRRHQRH